MTCYNFGNAVICTSAGYYRLRLLDGRYIFMEWHNYLGPIFFKDRAGTIEVESWWEDELLCEACNWFHRRGCKA